MRHALCSFAVHLCPSGPVPTPFPAGLLTSGIIPSMRHALGSLLTTDAVLLPASATVYVQAVELRSRDVCGLDMSAANLYRWYPAYTAGKLCPLSASPYLAGPLVKRLGGGDGLWERNGWIQGGFLSFMLAGLSGNHHHTVV